MGSNTKTRPGRQGAARHGTASRAPSAKRHDGPRRILWIDDDWTASSGDLESLRQVGYDIRAETAAAGCVLSARRMTVDLIIVGGRHAALDTLATLEELRRGDITTPVLVLSRLGDNRMAIVAGRLGADVSECRPMRGEPPVEAVRTALVARGMLRGRSSVQPKMELAEIHRPSSERLARVVVATSLHPTDWRSLRALAAAAGVGYGTLRAWCHSAGVRDRSFNRFCRMFRAVRLAPTTGSRPEDLLDVIEPRRLHLMFRDAGIDEGEQRLERYCERQTFIATRSGIAQIALSMIEH